MVPGLGSHKNERGRVGKAHTLPSALAPPPAPAPTPTPSLQKMQALEKNFKQQAGKDNSFHLQTVRNHISLGTEGGHPCSV